MDAVKEIVLTACTSLIVIEIIYFLTPKERLTDCIYALVYTAVLLSGILSATKAEWNFDFTTDIQPYKEEIDAYVQDYYLLETEAELKKTVVEALDTIHIACEKVELVLSIDDTETLSVSYIAVHLAYQSDIDRAKLILEKLFGNGIPLEVTGEK